MQSQCFQKSHPTTTPHHTTHTHKQHAPGHTERLGSPCRTHRHELGPPIKQALNIHQAISLARPTDGNSGLQKDGTANPKTFPTLLNPPTRIWAFKKSWRKKSIISPFSEGNPRLVFPLKNPFITSETHTRPSHPIRVAGAVFLGLTLQKGFSLKACAPATVG